jgi:hypothetical protein
MQIRFVGSLLLAGGILLLSAAAFAQDAAPTAPPPELPAYEQPVCPGDGYIWTPGYWAWAGQYYWVPGTWVMAPETGYLWTPGYWGWGGAGFMFNEGYWGLSVGFYGGIDYGFGYFGNGYEGGRWQNGSFFYNTSVNRLGGSGFRNVYDTRVNETVNHVSYNGGNGGINARATSQEAAAAQGRRNGPVAAQTQHAYAARNNPQQRLATGRSLPGVAATARPNMAVHPSELPPVQRFAAPSTGNAKLDRQYQQQQNKAVAQQNQDRQKLQQQQDKEHQQMTRQQANPAQMQQTEQRHQQQTQQMQQGHTQQMQQMQQRQSSGGGARAGGGGRR